MDMFQIRIYKEQAGSSIAKVSACALHILRPSPNCAEKVTNQWKKTFLKTVQVGQVGFSKFVL